VEAKSSEEAMKRAAPARAAPETRADGTRDQIGAIGPKLRKLRKKRGLSLRDLAGLSGLSFSFLSLVERGHSSLTLSSLHKVASALDADVASFFLSDPTARETHPLPHLTRARDDGAIAIEGAERTYKLLSGRAPERALEPLLVTIAPTEAIEVPFTHEGEEFAYLLQGRLLFVIGGVRYRLGPGDSIHFASTVPHAVQNDGHEPVKALWVLSRRLI
jgi:transcriptional regulator with XRE-family HTH domain